MCNGGARGQYLAGNGRTAPKGASLAAQISSHDVNYAASTHGDEAYLGHAGVVGELMLDTPRADIV